MSNAHNKVNFRDRSKIYKKFLSFLDTLEEKEHWRQCLYIIAYSKYKEEKFSAAYDHLNTLISSIEQEEFLLLSKNDSLEQKIINLPSQLSPGHLPYMNEFTENDIYGDQDLNKLVKLRIFVQKIFYFYGLMKFLDFKNKKEKIKKDNPNKKERKELIKESYPLLEDAILKFKKSLAINNTMYFNQIKCILTLVLISECQYYIEDCNESTNSLKEALIRFSDLNTYFFDKQLSDHIDPRVMFIINGIVMEQILFSLSKVCDKLGKRRLSGWILNKIMEVTLFRSNVVQKKASCILYKYLFHNHGDTTYVIQKMQLEKICNRFSNVNKKLNICVSENLLLNFNCSNELRLVLLKCIKKYVNRNDLISYFQFDKSIQCYFTQEDQGYNLKVFENSPRFCKYSSDIVFFTDSKNKTNFYQAIINSIEILTQNEDSSVLQQDKYIFLFIFSEDFKFTSAEESRKVYQKLLENSITVYAFCLDETITEKKIRNIRLYLKDLVEGYLILVKNFDIIEQCFQNISVIGTRKNIMDCNFDNHKYIL